MRTSSGIEMLVMYSQAMMLAGHGAKCGKKVITLTAKSKKMFLPGNTKDALTNVKND